MARNFWSTLYKWGMVAVGSLIFAAGINAFVLPHKLVSTGISGVSLVIYYLTNIPVGTINLILNIPIFWATWKWLGQSQILMTLYGTVLTSWFINALDFLQYLHLIKESMLSSMLAGVTTGVGLGIVYRVGGNTGGLDPIALIVRKYYGLQIGSILFGINGVILFCAAFVVGMEPVSITLISLYVYTIITNKVVIGFNQRKVAFIITSKSEEVCDRIIHKMGRGATILDGIGAYTKQPKQVILVAVNLLQVNRLKEIVDVVDYNAFMLITDAAEVIGKGFTKPLLTKEMSKALKSKTINTANTADGSKEFTADNTIKEDNSK